jgi:WD40 repeat protein
MSISMSKYAKDLFVFFCIGRKLLLALSVFHTRIEIVPSNTAHTSSAPLPGLSTRSSGIGHRLLSDAYASESNSGVIAGVADASKSELNRKAIMWAVPRDMHPKHQVPSKQSAVPSAVASVKSPFHEHIIRPLLYKSDKEMSDAREAARRAATGETAVEQPAQPKAAAPDVPTATPANGSTLPNTNGGDGRNGATAMEVDTNSKARTSGGSPVKNGRAAKQQPPSPGKAHKRTAEASDSEWPNVALFTVFNAKDALTCVDISRDATVVATGLNDSKVLLYETGEEAKGGPGGGGAAATTESSRQQRGGRSRSQFGQDSRALVGHSGAVYACSVSRDNEFLLTASEDGTVRLWVSLTSDMQTTAESVRRLDPQAFHWRNLVVYRQAPFSPVSSCEVEWVIGLGWSVGLGLDGWMDWLDGWLIDRSDFLDWIDELIHCLLAWLIH